MDVLFGGNLAIDGDLEVGRARVGRVDQHGSVERLAGPHVLRHLDRFNLELGGLGTARKRHHVDRYVADLVEGKVEVTGG